MKSYSRLFCLSMLALAAGASVSAQSLTAEQKAYASRLSGAARLQWLRKMGITPLAQKARAPFKIQPHALSSPLANVLVNDPTLDDAALLNGASDDAQNETTLLLIPGGVFVAAYNDGGSTANGLNAFSGYSRSTDGGGSGEQDAVSVSACAAAHRQCAGADDFSG